MTPSIEIIEVQTPGLQGPTGASGETPSISVGSTTTGAPGSEAEVTQGGTPSAVVLDFTIPTGETGPQGETGPGVPSGGTAGQIIEKVDGTAFNTQFINRPKVPANVYFDGANRAYCLLTDEGLVHTLQDTSVTAYRNIAGGFNGGGRGNKAFTNIRGYHGMSIAELTHISWIARVVAGTNDGLAMYLNIMFDLAGNGDAADVMIMVPKVTNALIFGNEFTEAEVLLGSAQTWAGVGGTGANGGSPVAGKAGIPAYSGQSEIHPACSLEHILTYNPNAKLWDGALLDGGQPKRANLGAFQYITGDSGSESFQKVCLYSARINDTIYQFGK